jgi:predicted membrane protein
MLVMKVRLQRKSVHLHLVPLLASKAALIVTAALVEEGLTHMMSNAALVVAIGLGIAVALLGPLGDHRFFTRTTPAAAATPAPTTNGRVR